MIVQIVGGPRDGVVMDIPDDSKYLEVYAHPGHPGIPVIEDPLDIYANLSPGVLRKLPVRLASDMDIWDGPLHVVDWNASSYDG